MGMLFAISGGGPDNRRCGCRNSRGHSGGDGGSNGGNGGTYKDGIKGGGMDVAGGIGGVYGGGNGAYCKYNGNVWTVNGGQGSFYGAGGGGVDYCYEWDESTGDYKASGYGHSVMGYQGVVYILIPR